VVLRELIRISEKAFFKLRVDVLLASFLEHDIASIKSHDFTTKVEFTKLMANQA
jgi:hypothetical protein